MAARTRVKVCGMTDATEARDAVSAGVDALGFIFVKESPRFIEPEIAREIIRRLPPFVDAVGVFVNEDPDVVNEIVQFCGLTLVQLHGNESPDYCRSIASRVIKVMSIRSKDDNPDFDSYSSAVCGFLLDTYHENMAGGTGLTFDWSVLDKITPPLPFILAGGLDPENAGDAVLKASPYAVDVNSGVEIEPGRKAIEKIRKFIQEVSRADEVKNA